MRSTYGKNYGTIANLATSSTSMTNGGPVVIENPDMLKKDETKTNATNGHDFSRSSFSNNSSKAKLYSRQNPTDKQIEARTSDGKRRITPIFIPPPRYSFKSHINHYIFNRMNASFKFFKNSLIT